MNAVTGQNIAGDSSTGISATDASTVDAPMDGSGTTGANVVEQPSPEKAVLSFSSFDGGGHEYSVEIEDPEILTYTSKRDYGARGDNVFPENYEPAINKMQEILDNAKIW